MKDQLKMKKTNNVENPRLIEVRDCYDFPVLAELAEKYKDLSDAYIESGENDYEIYVVYYREEIEQERIDRIQQASKKQQRLEKIARKEFDRLKKKFNFE
jgi:hypothetical protein